MKKNIAKTDLFERVIAANRLRKEMELLNCLIGGARVVVKLNEAQHHEIRRHIERVLTRSTPLVHHKEIGGRVLRRHAKAVADAVVAKLARTSLRLWQTRDLFTRYANYVDGCIVATLTGGSLRTDCRRIWAEIIAQPKRKRPTHRW